MKHTLLTAFALGLGSAVLSGCSDDKAEESTQPSQVAGLSESNGRMVLAPVEGNPAAIYFDLTYAGDKGISLTGAEVKGAKSSQIHDTMEWSGKMEMGEAPPIAMQKGDSVSFAPGGKHVMVFDPSPELKAGGKTEVTLKIMGGDSYSFTVPINAAGDDR